MDIIKEYIRDEDENKYSGISDNLKCYNDFDNYLKYGNFNIYEKCLLDISSYFCLILIISHYKYYTYFTDLTYRTEIFEAFEAILKEEFKNEIRKEKIKQIDMLHNI